MRKQHLGSVGRMALKARFVRLDKAHLTDRSDRLQLVERLGAPRETESAHPPPQPTPMRPGTTSIPRARNATI